MIGPMPATKQNGLAQQLRVFFDRSAHYYGDVGTDFAIKQFVREVDKLVNADAAGAWLLYAGVATLGGDLREAERCLENVERLGDVDGARFARFGVAVALGHFTAAADVFDDLCRISSGWMSEIFPAGPLTCSFGTMLDAMEAASRAGLELPSEPSDVAVACATALAELNLSEADARAMLDVAGEVLRGQRLFVPMLPPLVRSFHGDGEPTLLYQLCVKLSPEKAAALTDEVLEALIDRDLLKPGLLFSFVPA